MGYKSLKQEYFFNIHTLGTKCSPDVAPFYSIHLLYHTAVELKVKISGIFNQLNDSIWNRN